jgi:hypothetical protein
MRLGQQYLLSPTAALKGDCVVIRKAVRFNRGSRRRLERIRWKLAEIFSLAFLAIFVLAVSIFVVLWEVRQEHPDSEPTQGPEIRDAKPSSP